MRVILVMTDQSDAGVLLDTCAIFYIALGRGLRDEADQVAGAVLERGRLYLSPMSAWEIGIGVAKHRLKLPLEPLEFFNRFIKSLEAKTSDLSPEILIGSSNLPGAVHGDPMNRILVATARTLDLILVTSDRPILKYGADGNVRTLAC
jgi:PIN domain nuclease of toxin-antitoxin system